MCVYPKHLQNLVNEKSVVKTFNMYMYNILTI